MPYVPTELLYVLAALVVGILLYRYFTGHGGLEIRRPDYRGLPDEGRLEVNHHVVRWRAAEGDSFVAAWQLESGHFVVLRAVFEDVDTDDPDLGYIDVEIDQREAVSGASWTDKIRDRTLRSDVERILRMLQREATNARSDRTRLAGARSVGDDRSDAGGPDQDAGQAWGERRRGSGRGSDVDDVVEAIDEEVDLLVARLVRLGAESRDQVVQ